MTRTEEIYNELFQRYPALDPLRDDIRQAYEIICTCFRRGGKMLICGNGGSAADSEHIVGELMKGFMSKRPLSPRDKELFSETDGGEYLSRHLQGALPAISLSSHTALCSAVSNDVSPDMVFAQQVWGYAKNSPDVLMALSTSGNSANVVNAVKTANALDAESIGITGMASSDMGRLCTLCIRLPADETYKIQELTLPVYHTLCAMAEATYFKY